MTNYEIILTGETEALSDEPVPGPSTLSIKNPTFCGTVLKLKLGNQRPRTLLFAQ